MLPPSRSTCGRRCDGSASTLVRIVFIAVTAAVASAIVLGPPPSPNCFWASC